MLDFSGELLAAAALVIIVLALPSARNLIAELPEGRMRGQWLLLAALLALSAIGLAAYLALFWGRHQSLTDLLAPLLFLCGSVFALTSARTALATVINVRRMPALERADVTDALTGLHSRQYFDSRMREELMRAERHGLAVSVMLLDIDKFASINDAYGHDVGDQVLTEIGRIMSSSIRESDSLVRYGGEEMAVLATHTPFADALVVAERLRREIEVGARKALRDAQGARRAITVSVGVAGCDAGTKPGEDLFKLAEQALARAKQEGGNHVAGSP
jgi:diguanylate cyclase (GGDEF)-like protein